MAATGSAIDTAAGTLAYYLTPANMAKFTRGIKAALSTVDGFQKKIMDYDDLMHNRVDLIARKSTFETHFL